MTKIKEYGFKRFWSNGWNRFDFIIIFISVPSISTLFFESSLSNLSVILALRLLRILRIFRVFKFFPNINQITKGFVRALKQSRAILIAYIIIIFISGLINCCLFKNIAPEYFSTPLDSIYTVFRIFTLEGWYEIPNAVAEYYGASSVTAEFVRVYFCALLILGGIIGMSFINSIFVDAMVADNNDDVMTKLNELQKSIDELKEKSNINH